MPTLSCYFVVLRLRGFSLFCGISLAVASSPPQYYFDIKQFDLNNRRVFDQAPKTMDLVKRASRYTYNVGRVLAEHSMLLVSLANFSIVQLDFSFSGFSSHQL
jgi:hypothetical protein